jgi:hypothetical protein
MTGSTRLLQTSMTSDDPTAKFFVGALNVTAEKGQWAAAHDTTTHIDNFRNERSRSGNGMPHTGKHTRSGTPLRRGTAMLAQQELHNSTEDQNDSATGINQADLNSMAAHAARVRFADNLEAGWRFDVSDNLND